MTAPSQEDLIRIRRESTRHIAGERPRTAPTPRRNSWLPSSRTLMVWLFCAVLGFLFVIALVVLLA